MSLRKLDPDYLSLKIDEGIKENNSRKSAAYVAAIIGEFAVTGSLIGFTIYQIIPVRSIANIAGTLAGGAVLYRAFPFRKANKDEEGYLDFTEFNTKRREKYKHLM